MLTGVVGRDRFEICLSADPDLGPEVAIRMDKSTQVPRKNQPDSNLVLGIWNLFS